MKNKVWLWICLAFIAVGGIIACYIVVNPPSEDGDISAIKVNYLDASYSEDSAITVNGSENPYTISSAGTYILSGNFEQGITIDTKKDVYLVLDGVDIKNSNGAAIYVKAANNVYIIAKNSSNISDSEDYQNYGSEDVDAAIYSKDNLIFAGDATLKITGKHNHAVHSKDFIQILSGKLNITSINDGIVGKDYVAIKDGIVNIDAESDGIKGTDSNDSQLGYIAIDGGTITIDAVGDAINAMTRLSITGGTFDLTTGGGAKITSSDASWGNWSTNKSKENNVSAKGLKAEKYIYIADGDFTLNTSDDAIHSNTSIVIKGGRYSIKTGDDAIHADAAITISDGNIDITQSHEGIESSKITVNGGNISIADDDDGFNASGGNDSSSTNGRPGQNNFSSSTGELIITGGTIYVNSEGDGLDSNGSIKMTGGTVTVDGPTNNGNGALDYDSSFEISGGTLIAVGSSGMFQATSTNSTQNAIAIIFDNTQSANANFELKNENGNTILTYAPSKDYASIIISSPEIKTGNTYTAYVNDNKISDFTITSAVTSYGSGGMGQGGMNGPRR